MRQSRTTVFVLLALFSAVAIFLVACSASSNAGAGNTVGKQISGNQGVLLILQNANDITHLYLPYNGPEAPGARTKPSEATTDSPYGFARIGELNVLLQNIGGSVTAGGLYVSGYDPNLITVSSRPGQEPIKNDNKRNCVREISVNDNSYDLTIFCAPRNTGDIYYGGTVGGDGDQASVGATIGNLPLDDYANKIASWLTKDNVQWFTEVGLFKNNRVDCESRNGGRACRISFGSPDADPNRALRGFILLNMLYDEIAKCTNNCRVFPPLTQFDNGRVLHGVSDEYPAGDSLYYDYIIDVNEAAWPPLTNEMQQRFQITACYLYTTTVTPTVCIDPDPTTRTNEVCNPSVPIVFKGTQGAPIAITKIETRPSPQGVMFVVSLKHVGNGQFWQPGGMDQCGPYSPDRPDRRRQDVVQLLQAKVAGDLASLRCTPSTQLDNGGAATLIRFQNGVGTVNCFYPYAQTVGRNAYMTAMTMEFGYLYQNSISKDVTIHRT